MSKKHVATRVYDEEYEALELLVKMGIAKDFSELLREYIVPIGVNQMAWLMKIKQQENDNAETDTDN